MSRATNSDLETSPSPDEQSNCIKCLKLNGSCQWHLLYKLQNTRNWYYIHKLLVKAPWNQLRFICKINYFLFGLECQLFLFFLPIISTEMDVISVSKLRAKCKTHLNVSTDLVMMKCAQNDRSY